MRYTCNIHMIFMGHSWDIHIFDYFFLLLWSYSSSCEHLAPQSSPTMWPHTLTWSWSSKSMARDTCSHNFKQSLPRLQTLQLIISQHCVAHTLLAYHNSLSTVYYWFISGILNAKMMEVAVILPLIMKMMT